MENLTNDKICVGYCRFSSDMQREESIEAQKRFITGYCMQNSLTISHYYCDRAHSGKNMNRPALQQLLADAETGKFEILICHKMDRLSRNVQDTYDIVNKLKELGITLISVTEQFEATPSGNLMMGIISSFNQYYIENLATEVLKGQRENAYKCLSNGGKGCLGYDVQNKKYVINEEEAKAVRLIFTMYAEGNGYNAIIDKLNCLGYKTKAGKTFGKNSLYSILNNERYTGVYIFNEISRGNSHGQRNSHKKKSADEIIRIEGGIPAIISKALWNRVQAIRKTNPKGRSNNKYFYLLSGLVYCGECGAKMHGNPRNPGHGQPIYISYRCNRKDNNRNCSNKEIRCEYLEAFVVDALFDNFFNEQSIRIITQQLNDKLKAESVNKSEEYQQYKTSLTMMHKARNNLIDAITKVGCTDELSKKLKEIDSQIAICEDFIQQHDNSHSDIPTFTEGRVKTQLPILRDFVKHGKKEVIRSMIQSYIDRVTVFTDKVEVAFKVPFESAAADFNIINYTCNSWSPRTALPAIAESAHKNADTLKSA